LAECSFVGKKVNQRFVNLRAKLAQCWRKPGL